MAALDLAKRQVRWALETAPKLAPKGDSPSLTSEGEMWVVAMGFSNAFYAVRETLRNVEIQEDKTLRRVYHEWWKDGANKDFDRFLGTFRNALTHQGKFDLSHSVDWQIDHDHDTVMPRYSYPYAYVDHGDGTRTEYTFPELIHFCFEWWERKLAELEALYVASGGAASTPTPTSWPWTETNRPLFSADDDPGSI